MCAETSTDLLLESTESDRFLATAVNLALDLRLDDLFIIVLQFNAFLIVVFYSLLKETWTFAT